MKTLDQILVPVDFGSDTQTVVEAAARLADAFGAKLRLLYVIEEVPHFPAGLDLLRQAAEERLAKLHDDVVSRGIACESALSVVGRSFDGIVRTAEKLNVHLIVMGRGGTRTATRIGLGNTTARVMRRSPKPVFAVQPGTQGVVRRILCPVDGSTPSARGLHNAIQLAHGLDARLTVMTVIADLGPLYGTARRSDVAKVASDYQKMEREQFEQFIKGFDFGDVTWDKEVHYGHPAEEVVRLATDANYDLVVMGSTGRSGLPRALLGSTAESVARRVACSVLTVKREDVLLDRLGGDLSDLNRLVAEGQELLELGQYDAAIGRFDECLLKDPYLATAIEGQATAHEQLGHYDVASHLREHAQLIRHKLWQQPRPKAVSQSDKMSRIDCHSACGSSKPVETACEV
jgi:nucleotide-binding universal stress UspA family protein